MTGSPGRPPALFITCVRLLPPTYVSVCIDNAYQNIMAPMLARSKKKKSKASGFYATVACLWTISLKCHNFCLVFMFCFLNARFHHNVRGHRRRFCTEILIREASEGNRTEGSRHTAVADGLWWDVSPLFSALPSVCFLSQCFSTEPNPDICPMNLFQGA